MNIVFRFALAFATAIPMLHAGSAAAQSWPTKPVRFYVPAPAGTAPDILGRLIAEKLSPAWGQQVVVENRAGPGGIPGMSALVRAPNDAHTFAMLQSSVITLTPHMFKDPQFNGETDIMPIAMAGTAPVVVAVNTSLNVNSLADLIKLAKAEPGKVTFAAPILNSVPHLIGEMISAAAGIKLLAVPFNGSAQSIPATISGQTQMTIDALAPLAPQIKAGKLKAIAVTSERRLPGFDNLPTASETLPKFVAGGWFGIYGQAATPEIVANKINADVNTVTRMPEISNRFAELGVYVAPGTRKELADFAQADKALWAKIVKDMGIQPQ